MSDTKNAIRNDTKNETKNSVKNSKKNDAKRIRTLLLQVVYDMQDAKIILYCMIFIAAFSIFLGLVYLAMSISMVVNKDLGYFQNSIQNVLPTSYTATFILIIYSYGYLAKTAYRPYAKSQNLLNRERVHGSNEIYSTLSILPIKVTDVYRMQTPAWICMLVAIPINLAWANLLYYTNKEAYPLPNLLGFLNVMYLTFPLFATFGYFQDLIVKKRKNWISQKLSVCISLIGILELIFTYLLLVSEKLCMFFERYLPFRYFTGIHALILGVCILLVEIVVYQIFVVKNIHGKTSWE